MTALRGEAREVALAESQAVLGLAREDDTRARLSELVGQLDEGTVEGESEELLEQVLELGLQTGRIRAYYGPGGEQAAVKTLRRLPRGRVRTESTREVTEALDALTGATLERLSLTAVAPGCYSLAITADGIETSIRLDATGARVQSVGA